MGARGAEVAVSVWCEYMSGTRGSGIVSCADDVLEMSVVCRVRGVGGVCEICFSRGVVGGELESVGERIGFELYQFCGNRVSVGRGFGVCGVGGVGGGFGQWSGRMGVCCESRFLV